MEIDGQRNTCRFMEEAPNGHGSSWIGYEFYKVQGPRKMLGQLP